METKCMLTSLAVVLKSARLPVLPAETVPMVSEYFSSTAEWTLESATTAGHVHLLSVLSPGQWSGAPDKFRLLRRQWGMKQAAKFGHLQAIQWWFSSDTEASHRSTLDTRTLFVIAAENGRSNVLQWLDHNKLLPVWLSNHSIRMSIDDASVVYWLHDHRYTAPFSISCVKATKAGDCAFIQWVYHHYRYRLDVQETAYWAAQNGFAATVHWLYEVNSHIILSSAMSGAIAGGHLELIQWIQSIKETPIQVSGPVAVSLPMIKWILKNCEWADNSSRFKWIDIAIVCAIEADDYGAINLLYGSRMLSWFPYNRIAAAARTGNLRLLQWLHVVMGDVCSGIAMNTAAINGHLEVVTWLHHYCHDLLDENVAMSAIKHGHLHILQYIDTHSNQSEWVSREEMNMAASNGHLHIVQWLNEKGLRGGPVNVDEVVANGHLDVLKYLEKELGLACTVRGAALAATNGHFKLLEWAFKKNTKLVESFLVPTLRTQHG